jgi:hypothetical protein
VEFDTVQLDELRVKATAQGKAPTQVTERPRPPKSPVRLLVLVPDGWDGASVDLAVAGLLSGGEVATGSVKATAMQGEVVTVTVRLSGPCQDRCTAGEVRCVKDQIQLCQRDKSGCASFSPPEPCPKDKPHCSNGVCSATCSDECSTGQRRCVSEGGTQSCGQFDGDSCLDWSPVKSCGPKEICQASTGECILSCGGKPCECQPGQAEPCKPVGECSGGERHCVEGKLGPCEWKIGPQPEVCDGKDNDCNASVDDGLVAPACNKQAGVCKGATRQCGGAAGWSACSDADYATHDAAYEAVESTCDSKDNDCDGKVDEPAACCQPACAGKPCGALDGCGGICQSGACPPKHTCQGGLCICQPSCAGAACGGSDGCGGVCFTGTCPTGSTCQAGKCVSSNCQVPGAYCKSYYDCCDKWDSSCQSSKCCKKSGTSCKSNTDCCSGLPCANGKCGCSPPGSYCQSYSDCCDPYNSSCHSSKCCRESESSCKSNTDCCNGLPCTNGKCGCKPPGSYCYSYSDCCDKLESSCRSSKCCKTAGSSCNGPSDCCSGLPCVGGKCGCSPPGSYCLDYSDCCDKYGSSCRKSKCCKTAGSTCSSDAQCCSGLPCVGGKCACSPAGGYCYSYFDCCAGLKCKSSTCKY